MDRHKEIAQLAYQIYLRRVRYGIKGDHLSDWFEAERRCRGYELCIKESIQYANY